LASLPAIGRGVYANGLRATHKSLIVKELSLREGSAANHTPLEHSQGNRQEDSSIAASI
jgi:hypothetical protein